ELAAGGLCLELQVREQCLWEVARPYALGGIEHEDPMPRLDFDPVELRPTRVVEAEQLLRDLAVFLVQRAGGLIGALREAMGFIDDEEVVFFLVGADVERADYHRSGECGGSLEDIAHGLPQRLLRHHESDSK